MTYPPGVPVTAAQMAANMPQLLGSVILTASQGSISINIPAGYNHLQGSFTVRQDSTSGGAFCLLRVNNDSANHYTYQNFYGHATTPTTNNSGATSSLNIGVTPGPSDTASYFGGGAFTIGNIASSVAFKPVSSYWHCPVAVSNAYAGVGGGLWLSTSTVTSVQLLPSSGNLVAGSSMSIYGWQ